ncbi:hypothetical protein C8238_16420 [Paracidovorax avenae]|uniref:hypothetical protein n=1 Tax=Paracidovorax avenae TaxID=80867 RepID=UPI000D173824|nr:hypothetical protein [Paracidovorax avenae]AVS89622.1 hypothetical protein C8238_16420 [Paracidovorax avenae]
MIKIDQNKLIEMSNRLPSSAAQVAFGHAGAAAFARLISGLVQIYSRHDPGSRTDPLAIFVDATLLPSHVGPPLADVASIDNLTNELQGPKLVRLTGTGRVEVMQLDPAVLSALSVTAIVYFFRPGEEKFLIAGQMYDVDKVVIGYPSAYCKPTFGTLKDALEDYRVRSAAHTTCYVLEEAWADPKRLRFKNKPEEVMRRSLTQFLRCVLRDAHVRPEQNVDETHPVDIHVSFVNTTQHAIIEIKWLGKSVKADGSHDGTEYTQVRALSGAQQLAEYLDSTHQSSPHFGARGYLVVFDGRRRGLSAAATTLDAANGHHYETAEITYEPDHASTRKDFAPPVRMFLYPKLA